MCLKEITEIHYVSLDAQNIFNSMHTKPYSALVTRTTTSERVCCCDRCNILKNLSSWIALNTCLMDVYIYGLLYTAETEKPKCMEETERNYFCQHFWKCFFILPLNMTFKVNFYSLFWIEWVPLDLIQPCRTFIFAIVHYHYH